MFSNQSNITWYLVHLDTEPMFKRITEHGEGDGWESRCVRVRACLFDGSRACVLCKNGVKSDDGDIRHSRYYYTLAMGWHAMRATILRAMCLSPCCVDGLPFICGKAYMIVGISLSWKIDKYTIIMCRYNHNSDVPRLNKRDMNNDNNNNPGL